ERHVHPGRDMASLLRNHIVLNGLATAHRACAAAPGGTRIGNRVAHLEGHDIRREAITPREPSAGQPFRLSLPRVSVRKPFELTFRAAVPGARYNRSRRSFLHWTADASCTYQTG